MQGWGRITPQAPKGPMGLGRTQQDRTTPDFRESRSCKQPTFLFFLSSFLCEEDVCLNSNGIAVHGDVAQAQANSVALISKAAVSKLISTFIRAHKQSDICAVVSTVYHVDALQ